MQTGKKIDIIMRILKILKGNDTGGVFTCETQFINHWKTQNVKVDGIIVGGGNAVLKYKEILDDFHEAPESNYFYRGSLLNILSSLIKTRTYANRLLKVTELNHKYDAILFRRPMFLHLAGLLGSKYNIRVLWHLPNSVNRKLGKIYYNYYIGSYSILPVANSHYTKKTLGKICKEVVYPGFERTRVQPTSDTLRNELNIPEDACVFGTASRITHEKAQDLLIGGLIKSGLLEKNVHCIIAGDLNEEDYVKSLRELSKDYISRIHFIGRIENTSRFYSSIDTYINSRRNEEPFGISVAEAMAAGLPVIAFYKGGPSEMIKDGENGWLIEKADINSYAKTFLKAFQQRSRWKVMGNESREKSFIYESSYNADKLLSLI
jgi:glycosyltransferase involved in cell wall biosynthesis